MTAADGNHGTYGTYGTDVQKPVRRRPYNAVVRELEALKAAVAGSLINRQAVELLALDFSQKMRRGKFTRVSKEFLDDIEAQVRTMVNHRVHRAPGVGKTL